ncbi:tetratricopeptide repeat protein [Effusibacillus dendaii]|uniref:Tetratricopeptide repeat protein n=1 Tax=Effusibacillus dendaii TaxID=2743772 RepID=A0A7I8D608_9BACL|nr:tetratricopeptide repeat protein [Effusibacillus dendaii]BCJ85427.1 hypothetical protein skT53_04120 [Effusibacillus dendaii]
MFDKPFDQLFRALQRIEKQLAGAGLEEKQILQEELIALRALCDRFVEKWLTFEEKISNLADQYNLQIDTVESPAPVFKPQPQPQAPEKKIEWQPISGKAADKPVKVMAPPLLPRAEEELLIQSFRKGLGYFDLLMYPDAIRELERVVELDGDFMIARLYLAFGYAGKKEHGKAIEQLHVVASAVKEPFLAATVHHTFGHIYAEQEQFQQAIEQFKQAASHFKEFRDIHFNLGVCQYNLKQYNEALASFLAALDQEPNDWEAERIVSAIWRRLGSLPKAIAHIEKAYRLNSTDFHILMQYGDLMLQNGQVGLAYSLYERANRFHPYEVEPIGAIGWLHMREGNYPDAIACFKKQLSLKRDHIQSQINLGWAMLMAGDYQRAGRIFTRVMQRFPQSIEAQIGTARVLFQMRQTDDAHQIVSQIMESGNFTQRKIGLLQSGCFALQEGDYRTAIERFASALQIDPRCKETLFFKGVAHSGLGESELAEQCWHRLQENPVPL